MKMSIIIAFAAVAMLFSSCAVTRHGEIVPAVPVPVVVTARPYYYSPYYYGSYYRPYYYAPRYTPRRPAPAPRPRPHHHR